MFKKEKMDKKKIINDKKYKPFIIKIRNQEVAQNWSDTSPDDYDYDSDDFAIDGGSATMDSDYGEIIKTLIGDEGEYVDWLELGVDELFCEEWVIYEEDILENLAEHFLGYDDVELIVEESMNEWKKINGEWVIT